MSNSIDQRTVEMVFDNAQFEKGVAETIKSLDSLDQSLGLKNTGRIENDIAQLSKDVSGLDVVAEQISDGKSKIEQAFETLASGFGKATLVASAITAGIGAITAAFNFQGGWNRALNLENAKFQLSGLGIAWEDVAGSINHAVEDTAYGLDSAAKAAAQLSASNVALGEDMDKALRGISGVAAMTNSSYDEIAHTFARVAGNGRVMAIDLRSIAARGLNAAAKLAEYYQVTEQELYDMVSKGKVDFQTFANVMDDAFGEHATKANETFNGALMNMNAAWSRFWANFLTPEGGNILDMMRRIFLAIKGYVSGLKVMFDPLAKTVGKWSGAIADFAESFFDSLGRLFFAIESDENGKKVTVLTSIGEKIGRVFTNLYDVIESVIGPIRRALESVIPPFEQIYNFVDSIPFDGFFARLKLTTGESWFLEQALTSLLTVLSTIANFIFSTVFSVFEGLAVVAGVVRDSIGYLANQLYYFVIKGMKSFEKGLSGVNEGLSRFGESINASYLLNNPLANLIKDLIVLFSELYGIFTDQIINGFDGSAFPEFLDKVRDKFGQIIDRVKDFVIEIGIQLPKLDGSFAKLGNLFQSLWDIFTNPAIPASMFTGFLGETLANIANAFLDTAALIFSVISDLGKVVGNFLGWAIPVATSALGGIGSVLVTFAQGLGSVLSNFGGGFLNGLFGIEEEANSVASSTDEAADSVENSLDRMEESTADKHPILKFLDGMGEAFGKLSDKLDEGPLEAADWMRFFYNIKSVFGEFVGWLDPIGRITEAINSLKYAFEGFGTEEFVGWGDKFVDPASPWYNILNSISETLSNIWKGIVDHLPSAEQVGEAFGFIVEGLGNVFDAIGPFIEGFGRLLGSGLKSLFDALGDMFGSVEEVGAAAKPALDTVKSVGEQFNDFTKEIVGEKGSMALDAAEKVKSISSTIDTVMGNVGSAFGNLDQLKALTDHSGISGLISMFTMIGDALPQPVLRAAEASEQMADVSDDVKESGSMFGGALEFLGDNFMTIAKLGLGAGALVVVGKTLLSFGKLAKSVGKLVDTINAVTGKVAKVTGAQTSTQTALDKLGTVIKSLVALAAAVIILSFIEPDRLWPAVGAVAALAAIVVAIIAATMLMNKHIAIGSNDNPAQKATNIGVQIAGVAAALMMTALALKVIASIPSDSILPAMGVLAALSAGLLGIAHFMEKETKHLIISSIGLAMLGGVLLEFAIIIGIFSILPWGEMLDGIAAVFGLLGGLTGISMGLSAASKGLVKASFAMILLSFVLGNIVSALIMLNNFGGDDIVRNAAIIGLLFGELAASVILISRFAKESAALKPAINAVTTLSMLLVVISFAISMIAVFDPMHVVASAATLVAALGALALIYAAMVKFADSYSVTSINGFALSMVALSAAVLVLSKAVQNLSAMDPTSMVAAAAALTIMMGALAGMVVIMQKFTVFNPTSFIVIGAALLSLAVSMKVLSEAIKGLDGISWDGVAQLLVFLLALTGLGAIAGFLTPIALGILAIGGAILMLGGGVLAAGQGFNLFSESIKNLAEWLVPFAESFDQFIEKTTATMQSRFPEALDVFMENLNQFSERTPEIMLSVSRVVVAIVEGICRALAESVPSILESLMQMMETAIGWMGQNGDRLRDDLMGFASVLGELLGDVLLTIPSLLVGVIGTITQAISDMIVNAGRDIARNTVASYSEAYANEASKLTAEEMAAVLSAYQNMNYGDLKISGSTTWSGGSSTFAYDTEAAQKLAAILSTIYGDSTMYAAVTAELKEQGLTVDEIARRYQDLYGNQNQWVESIDTGNDSLSETVDYSEKLIYNNGSIVKNLNPMFEKLASTEGFSNLNIQAEEFGSLLEYIGGDPIQGLNLAISDTATLSEGLVAIFGEDFIAAMAESGISVEDLQQMIASSAGDAEFQMSNVSEEAENAKYTLEEVATALANGVDVTAALSSMENLRSGIYDLRDAFNEVNVNATSSFNNMTTNLSVDIAKLKADLGTLPTKMAAVLATMNATLVSNASTLSDSAYAIGSNLAIGIANGISDYAYRAINAGKSLARETNAAIKAEFAEKSPSKKGYEMGQFLGIGIGLGIQDSISMVTSSGVDLAESAVDALQTNLRSASYILEGIDWDASPTIRPVLDTSSVEEGMLYMNSLFGLSPMMQAAYAGSRIDRTFPGSGGNSKVFNIDVNLGGYHAGTDASRMVEDIANGLAEKLNMEG